MTQLTKISIDPFLTSVFGMFLVKALKGSAKDFLLHVIS
jgi:hypothetical protein